MESKRHQASQRMRDEAFKVMLQDPCKNTPALDAAVAAYLEATEIQEQTPMSATTEFRPAWARGITDGDWLTIKKPFMTRGGQSGRVVGEPSSAGVALDFGCDVFGDPDGLPTIEFWEWTEIDPDLLPAGAQ